MHSFGFDAEDKFKQITDEEEEDEDSDVDNETENSEDIVLASWRLFHQFKMSLYENKVHIAFLMLRKHLKNKYMYLLESSEDLK